MDADFLHALIHDLKGPVSRLRMLGELLERRLGNLDPEAKVLIGHMGTSASAAENVLQAVRRYAETIGRPFEPQRIELTVAVAAAVARLEARLEASGGTVEQGALPAVQGDGKLLTTLFEELISNSLRFCSDQPPRIEIGAEPAGPGWWVFVRDNGIGIRDTDSARIFRPFTKASDRAGAGIGLAICSWIICRHGGSIEAVPRPEGAELRVKFPS